MYNLIHHQGAIIQWADSHLNLSTRGSRHQLCDLPQVNATCQVHLSGVDLQDVKTGLVKHN